MSLQLAPNIEHILQSAQALVVLAPHPDDEIFGCAGLIQAARTLRMSIYTYVLTDGERCFGELPKNTLQHVRNRRRQESLRAARMLDIAPPQFLDWGDGQLMQRQRTLRRLLQRHASPRVICAAPWHLDGHPDHEAVGEVVHDMAQQGCLQALLYPVWALVDTPRKEVLLNSPHLCTLELTHSFQMRKRHASEIFHSQIQAPRLAPAAFEQPLVNRQQLQAFNAHQEYYWHVAGI